MRIDQGGLQCERKARGHRDSGAQGGFRHLAHPVYKRRNVNGRGPKLLLSRKGQHPLRQRRSSVETRQRRLENRLGARVVRKALSKQFQRAPHCHQQVIKVVGHATGQLANGFHLLGLEKCLTGFFELLGSCALLGHIARNLRKADEGAIVVKNAVDDDMGPETASVFPYPPALVFGPTCRCRNREVALGNAGGAVLFSLKARKMTADNVVGLIALDAFSARIPARHMARRVQHIHGVIGHALDKNPELRLARV